MGRRTASGGTDGALETVPLLAEGEEEQEEEEAELGMGTNNWTSVLKPARTAATARAMDQIPTSRATWVITHLAFVIR